MDHLLEGETNFSVTQRCDTYLKVVSATFLFVCFSSLKDSTYETWKNVLYFTSKAFFVFEKIKF